MATRKKLPRPAPPKRWTNSAAPISNVAFTGEVERATRQGTEARDTYVHPAYRTRGSVSKRRALLDKQAQIKAEFLAAMQG